MLIAWIAVEFIANGWHPGWWSVAAIPVVILSTIGAFLSWELLADSTELNPRQLRALRYNMGGPLPELACDRGDQATTVRRTASLIGWIQS